ncbi:PHP domain-containing protein [Candidatus Gracilibacteria bacterium]|nr:PHP domain-containing protein [Candidatus Gracilibacteria bacterium]
MNHKNDFHMHSTYSDGTLTVSQLFEVLNDIGVDYFSITDHDTIGSCKELSQLNGNKGAIGIPGIEITTHYQGKILHLLAYGFDSGNSEFLQFLDQQRFARRERAVNIVAMLNQDLENEGKIPIPIDEILKLEIEGPITRPDIANYLINIGYAVSFQEAFDKWLKKYDLPLVTSDITKSIEIVREIGGVAVLAHAFAPRVSLQAITQDTTRQVEILLELKKAGLQGLEIYFSNYEKDTNGRISNNINKADGLNLLVTGGSDFHGGGKTNSTLPGILIPHHRVQKFLDEVYKK